MRQPRAADRVPGVAAGTPGVRVSRCPGRNPLASLSAWQQALVFLAAYTLVGLAGMALQSAQAGVTPIWPASGVALGLCCWFGLRYALLILPGMLLLALILGVSLSVALLAGIGSVLETGVAVWLLQRLRIDPGLRQLRDTLSFVAVAAVLAPVFSALPGSWAMLTLAGSPVAPLHLGLTWWLGNSLGTLLVGGLMLVAANAAPLSRGGHQWLELAALSLLAVLLTWLGIHFAAQVSSALFLYLLVPLIVVAALRAGQLGVLLVGALILVAMILANSSLPHESLGRDGLGTFYLDISLIWMASFTGLMVASAHQERRHRERISWLATHDPLTRLVNRHEFGQRLEQALQTVAEHGRSHAVLCIDLDRFKRINDVEGHAAGDRVLRDVASLLTREVRRHDTAARFGGDEFALLLESCPLVEACGIAENIRHAVQDYVYEGAKGHYDVEVSVGVVEADGRHDGGAVLHAADVACYEAKRAGRNRVWVGSVDPGGVAIEVPG